MYIEGINPGDSYVASLEAPLPFAPGQRGMDGQGREYVFQVETGAHTAGDVVLLSLGNTGVSLPLTLTVASTNYNRQVGVVASTFAAAAAGTGYWAQVLGQAFAGIRAAAAAIVNTRTYSTATPNAVDDDPTANYLIRGMSFTTAATGAGVFAGLLNYPTVGTLIDSDNQA